MVPQNVGIFSAAVDRDGIFRVKMGPPAEHLYDNPCAYDAWFLRKHVEALVSRGHRAVGFRKSSRGLHVTIELNPQAVESRTERRHAKIPFPKKGVVLWEAPRGLTWKLCCSILQPRRIVRSVRRGKNYLEWLTTTLQDWQHEPSFNRFANQPPDFHPLWSTMTEGKRVHRIVQMNDRRLRFYFRASAWSVGDSQIFESVRGELTDFQFKSVALVPNPSLVIPVHYKRGTELEFPRVWLLEKPTLSECATFLKRSKRAAKAVQRRTHDIGVRSNRLVKFRVERARTRRG